MLFCILKYTWTLMLQSKPLCIIIERRKHFIRFYLIFKRVLRYSVQFVSTQWRLHSVNMASNDTLSANFSLQFEMNKIISSSILDHNCVCVFRVYFRLKLFNRTSFIGCKEKKHTHTRVKTYQMSLNRRLATLVVRDKYTNWLAVVKHEQSCARANCGF